MSPITQEPTQTSSQLRSRTLTRKNTMKSCTAASFSSDRGMPSEYNFFQGRDRANSVQPCPYLLAQRHCLDSIPTHLLPVLAENGLEDHDRSLHTRILRLDHGSQSQMSAISSTVAACAAAANHVHSITQNSHNDKLCQRRDRYLRRSCDIAHLHWLTPSSFLVSLSRCSGISINHCERMICSLRRVSELLRKSVDLL